MPFTGLSNISILQYTFVGASPSDRGVNIMLKRMAHFQVIINFLRSGCIRASFLLWAKYTTESDLAIVDAASEFSTAKLLSPSRLPYRCASLVWPTSDDTISYSHLPICCSQHYNATHQYDGMIEGGRDPHSAREIVRGGVECREVDWLLGLRLYHYHLRSLKVLYERVTHSFSSCSLTPLISTIVTEPNDLVWIKWNDQLRLWHLS